MTHPSLARYLLCISRMLVSEASCERELAHLKRVVRAERTRMLADNAVAEMFVKRTMDDTTTTTLPAVRAPLGLDDEMLTRMISAWYVMKSDKTVKEKAAAACAATSTTYTCGLCGESDQSAKDGRRQCASCRKTYCLPCIRKVWQSRSLNDKIYRCSMCTPAV